MDESSSSVKSDHNNNTKDVEKNNEYIDENRPVNLEKNDYIITSKGISKITDINDEDDPELMKMKLDVGGKKETVYYRDLVFSIYRNVRIIVTTYDNKILDLQYPVNINLTFEDFLSKFCDDYYLLEKQVCIIFRGNKVSKKEKEKFKLNKDFDFDKDFILIVIGPSQECWMQINKCIKRSEVNCFSSFKYLIKVNKPIFLTGLYIFTAWYQDYVFTYKDFSFSVVNNMPDEFTKAEPKKDEKKKKSAKNDDIPAETFDSFFNAPEKFDMEVINNFDSLDVYREADEYNSESESERDEEYYEKKNLHNGKLHKVEFDKYLMVPEKFYYVSMKAGSNSGNVNFVSCKVPNRVQNSKSVNDVLNVKIYIGNNQKETLVIGGMSWIMKSCFN